MIIEDLARTLLPSVGVRSVADVRVGLGYTAVMLDDGNVGVAVEDGPGILHVVGEGGGMGLFGRRVKKVNLRLTA